MSAIRIVSPGMLTTIQDEGRWGWQRFGVAVAGPMDPFAHRLANALVGNDRRAAAFEMTLTGPELQFDETRIVAATGAEFEVTVDAVQQPMHVPFVVSAGSILRFGARRRGARAYLAVAGGVDVPMVFDSRSTHLSSGMGGFEGRALRGGDVVPLGEAPASRTGRASPFIGGIVSLPPPGATSVRVLPGPQLGRFASSALDLLQSAPYRVDTNSNRVGFRLCGANIPRDQGGDMLSDATMAGAIQVPGSGQPILLMADRPTSGGYPIVATIISADLGMAGQLAPGDDVSFVVTNAREAMSLLIAKEQALMAVESTARP